MPSEKYAARRGSVEDGRRMITACFARVPQRCTSRTYMHFLLMFQEVRPISKTRNQLNTCVQEPMNHCWSHSSTNPRTFTPCILSAFLKGKASVSDFSLR